MQEPIGFSLIFLIRILEHLCKGKWKVKVAHSCPPLCNPMDYTVYGILQARILEWVAFLFSRGFSQPKDQTQVSCIQADSLPAEPQGKPTNCKGRKFKIKKPLFLGCSYFCSFTCGWSQPLPGLPPPPQGVRDTARSRTQVPHSQSHALERHSATSWLRLCVLETGSQHSDPSL